MRGLEDNFLLQDRDENYLKDLMKYMTCCGEIEVKISPFLRCTYPINDMIVSCDYVLYCLILLYHT